MDEGCQKFGLESAGTSSEAKEMMPPEWQISLKSLMSIYDLLTNMSVDCLLDGLGEGSLAKEVINLFRRFGRNEIAQKEFEVLLENAIGNSGHYIEALEGKYNFDNNGNLIVSDVQKLAALMASLRVGNPWHLEHAQDLALERDEAG